MNQTTAWHAIICRYYIMSWMGELTVLMGACALRWAARAVSRGSEAQYRGVVFCVLFQARDVTNMNTVLEVGTGRHHTDLIWTSEFPRQKLEMIRDRVLILWHTTGGINMYEPTYKVKSRINNVDIFEACDSWKCRAFKLALTTRVHQFTERGCSPCIPGWFHW